MINEKIKQERKNYLGGSDAPAVLGISRFRTPLQVWGEKTGRFPIQDISDTLPVKIGNALEDFVAKLWCAETGKKVRRNNRTFFSKEYPFIAGNIDREVVGEKAFLEVKTAGEFMRDEWEGDSIPQEYMAQILHYLYVTGYDKCYVAVLIGNREFKKYEIFRKDYEDVINKIIEKEVYFWNEFVLKGIPPAVKSMDSELINNAFPNSVDTTEIVDLDDEYTRMIETLEGLKEDKKAIENKIKEIENKIKFAMGDKPVAKANWYLIQWKNTERETIDTNKLKENHPDIYEKYRKITNYRRFSIKKIEE